MRISRFGRSALPGCVAAAVLASCGALPLSLSKGQHSMQPLVGAPGAMAQSAASSPLYSVLHRFSYDEEDRPARPTAGLINVGGTLYGTTFGKVSNGNGTVFSIRTTGKHKTLYRFDDR